ncbi:MAG: DUF5691 domain-containing protein [Candidatus Accumulibacter sp.]|jgi:hypothetical protein|nr:DUF5691 domain-containing protein [Accumulibacter sp.]
MSASSSFPRLAPQFAALRDCWITGGSAAALAPEDWRALTAGTDAEERERRLVALAGQAWDVAFRPALPREAARRKDLPRLALPTVPEQWRSLFRYALEQASGVNVNVNGVLRLVERRGFCAHPLDWMPTASTEDAPDLYAPWQDWVQSLDGEDGKDGKDEASELDEESWDSFYPAQRRRLLKAMRGREADRACQLIAARAAEEPAEKRLALIETLAVGLSENDAPYLQSLVASDRSGKVKALAARFLARLRHRSEGAPQEELAELADFFELGRAGIFKRHASVSAKAVKSQAQANRRMELFECFSFADLAGALGVSEAEVIDGWQFGDRDKLAPTADDGLARMVAASAADEFVARLAERLFAVKEAIPLLLRLLPRLDRAGQRRVMLGILAGRRLWPLTRIEHGDLAGPDDILSSQAYQAVKSEFREARENGGAPHLLSSFNALAGVATAEAAKAALDDIAVSLGVFPASPALAFLRLNLELARAAASST